MAARGNQNFPVFLAKQTFVLRLDDGRADRRLFDVGEAKRKKSFLHRLEGAFGERGKERRRDRGVDFFVLFEDRFGEVQIVTDFFAILGADQKALAA